MIYQIKLREVFDRKKLLPHLNHHEYYLFLRNFDGIKKLFLANQFF